MNQQDGTLGPGFEDISKQNRCYGTALRILGNKISGHLQNPPSIFYYRLQPDLRGVVKKASKLIALN
jgi:hypothetical protein